MSDNPFAEPDDDARTVILPLAQARAALDARPPAGPRRDAPIISAPAASAGGSFADLPPLGRSPVLSAAAPVLALIGRLRNVISVPDPAALRHAAITEMRRYEQTLRDLRMPVDQIRTAHYALCASLDDVVQNTPWGSQGPWANHSLVSAFHQEVRSGDRFFEVLTRLCQNSAQFLPVIELMYVCMALGMQGRYRLSPQGPAELDRVREATFTVIIGQRGTAERALSPHWQGVRAPYRRLRGTLPVWVAALGSAGLLGLLYAVFTLNLNTQSDRLFEAAAALPPATMPELRRSAPPAPLPPAPRVAGPRDALAGLLAADMRNSLITIAGSDAIPVLRLESTGMFASGSADIEAAFTPVLQRIAGALKDRGDALQIIGYTDNQPIHTVAFPSNYTLSTARARAAASVLAETINRGRISAEGRADADPIADNASPAGRQRNRRIEIVLHPAGAR